MFLVETAAERVARTKELANSPGGALPNQPIPDFYYGKQAGGLCQLNFVCVSAQITGHSFENN